MVDGGDSSDAGRLAAVVSGAVGSWELDQGGSRVEFHVKHFWGAVTVHGLFERFSGRGSVEADGSIAGRLEIEAASLTTKNRKRDEHLRSPDFFDVESHPQVVVSVQGLSVGDDGTLRGTITLEAAGRTRPVTPTVQVVEATADTVTLRSELVVDRTGFDMTWSPLGMAAGDARAVVTARFHRRR
jgi:polyisoprenoid-binding protein YceI